MSEYNLTLYLYAKDEVELSFIAAIFLRKGVDECYYWGYELHYSGFDVFPIIWKTYYDFYFVSNPGLETLIRHKEKMWERNKKLHYLAATISNLVNTPSSGEVFIIRQYIERARVFRTRIYCARKTSGVVRFMGGFALGWRRRVGCAKRRSEGGSTIYGTRLVGASDSLLIVQMKR